jgi:putative hemolysin
VLRLGDRPVRAVMTPRLEVDWIDLNLDQALIREIIRDSRHARLVAARGTLDEPVGVVQVKDVLDALLIGHAFDIAPSVRQAPVIHDRFDALEAVEHLRRPGVHMALVVDEHGAFEGVITRGDILASIAGEFGEAGEAEGRPVRRADGSWLFDGLTPIDEVASAIGASIPPTRAYHTLAGFLLERFRRLPTTGEFVEAFGWRFEVVDMDGRRIDQVLVAEVPAKRAG